MKYSKAGFAVTTDLLWGSSGIQITGIIPEI
jgi:hypothetical protein